MVSLCIQKQAPCVRTTHARANPVPGLSAAVRALIHPRLERLRTAVGVEPDLMVPGKMIRTGLAGRMEESGACRVSRETIAATCAATELVHTASLLHDDVIDEAPLRRRRPALWTCIGRSAAVLMGDALLCEAIDTVLRVEHGQYAALFVAKVRQVVEAEARQELLERGQALDTAACLRMAQEKTGPLFSFVTEVCAGSDWHLRHAMGRAGELIGAAYQLADDMLDVIGSEDRAGKTLGTDGLRGKFTLPQGGPPRLDETADMVDRLLDEAVAALAEWPAAQQGAASFICNDLKAVFAAQGMAFSKDEVG